MLITLTADEDNEDFVPETPGEYHMIIAPTDIGDVGGQNIGGGALTVSQDGVPWTELTALGVGDIPMRRLVTLRGGAAVKLALSGSTNPDLDILIEKNLTKTKPG
jgi:hypothetical protein